MSTNNSDTPNSEPSPSPDEVLQAKITLETAQIGWRELQRFFASGRAVAVDSSLDLVAVAAALGNDNKTQFESWLGQGLVSAVSDEQAGTWYTEDALVWAVVVAPWVLVQQVAS